MKSISKIKLVCVLALTVGLSLPSSMFSAAHARSIFDLIGSDFDTYFPFSQVDTSYMPRIDIDSSGEIVKVTAEVPGIEANNLNVRLTDDEVYIKGEKKEEKQTSKYSGAFQRKLTLPCLVESEKAQAKLKNGVLTITVPKSNDTAKKGNTLTIQTD